MKFDYFDALEALAVKAFNGASDADSEALSIIQHLATDFITPIERADIADIALSLRRCAEAGRQCTKEKSQGIAGLQEAVTEYVRALRRLGKKGGAISARLYFTRSRESAATVRTAEERQYAETLCRCCETLIHAVMNNI